MTNGRSRTVQSVFWTMTETSSLAITSLVVLIALARYLSADELGLASLALGMAQILCAVVEVMFHDALVQKKDLTPTQVDAAHTITVVVGLVLTVFLVAGAPVYAAWIQQPKVAALLAWMAPSVALTALSAVPVARMRRELDFRLVAIRTLSGRLAGAAVGIAAAMSGLAGWSLVLQQNVTVLVSTVSLFLLGSKYWPEFSRPQGAAPLFSFAGTSLILNLLWGNISKIFLICCGLIMPAGVVGEIALAMRMVDMLASIVAGALNKVALPLFAKFQQAGGNVATAYVSATRATATLTTPLFAGLALVAHELVLLIAGARWAAAATMLRVFSLAQMVRALFYLASPFLTALGALRANLLISISELVVMLAFLFFLRSGEAWAWRFVATVPMTVLVLRHVTNVTARDWCAGVANALAATLIMTLSVLALRFSAITDSQVGMLAASVAVGIMTFVVSIALLERRRAIEIYHTLRSYPFWSKK